MTASHSLWFVLKKLSAFFTYLEQYSMGRSGPMVFPWRKTHPICLWQVLIATTNFSVELYNSKNGGVKNNSLRVYRSFFSSLLRTSNFVGCSFPIFIFSCVEILERFRNKTTKKLYRAPRMSKFPLPLTDS